MFAKYFPYLSLSFMTASLVFSSMWLDKHQEHVVITEQDEVRWCMNRLTDSPHNQKAINYYCYELHGFELMDRGVKPNYDKFPKLY